MTDPSECACEKGQPTYRLIIDPPITSLEAERQRRRGLAVVPRGRLEDARTGKLQISATLDYIEAAILARGLVVVSREQRRPDDAKMRSLTSEGTEIDGLSQ